MAIEPDEINGWFGQINSSPIIEKQKAQKILLRPDVELQEFAVAIPRLKEALSPFTREAIEQAAIQVKYDVYIEKEKELRKGKRAGTANVSIGGTGNSGSIRL